VLASASAELEGAFARARGSVAQFAAGERQEHALQRGSSTMNFLMRPPNRDNSISANASPLDLITISTSLRWARPEKAATISTAVGSSLATTRMNCWP
jgi:hypothetical protein